MYEFSILGLLALGLLGIGIGVYRAYASIKKTLSDDRMIEIADLFLTELTENVEWQKRTYVIGGLLGQGIKKGIGIGKTGGKFKMEDMMSQIVGTFIQKAFGGAEQQQQSSSPEKPLDLNVS